MQRDGIHRKDRERAHVLDESDHESPTMRAGSRFRRRFRKIESTLAQASRNLRFSGDEGFRRAFADADFSGSP